MGLTRDIKDTTAALEADGAVSTEVKEFPGVFGWRKIFWKYFYYKRHRSRWCSWGKDRLIVCFLKCSDCFGSCVQDQSLKVAWFCGSTKTVFRQGGSVPQWTLTMTSAAPRFASVRGRSAELLLAITRGARVAWAQKMAECHIFSNSPHLHGLTAHINLITKVTHFLRQVAIRGASCCQQDHPDPDCRWGFGFHFFFDSLGAWKLEETQVRLNWSWRRFGKLESEVKKGRLVGFIYKLCVMQGETYHGTVDGQNPVPLRMMIIPKINSFFFLHPRLVVLLYHQHMPWNRPRAVRLHDWNFQAHESFGKTFSFLQVSQQPGLLVVITVWPDAKKMWLLQNMMLPGCPPTFVGIFRRSYGVNQILVCLLNFLESQAPVLQNNRTNHSTLTVRSKMLTVFSCQWTVARCLLMTSAKNVLQLFWRLLERNLMLDP